MKQSLLFILILSILTSCTKDSNTIIVETKPYTPNHNTFITETNENLIKTTYKYSTIWRLTEIQTFDNEVPTEKISITYNNNLVTKASNKNNTSYKYYLNKKGLADSLKINVIGLLSITELYKYDINGYIIRKDINALINNVPYEEYTDYTIKNGNIIKSVQTTDTDVFTTDFEYYEDSTNVLAGTLEAISFIPQSKNLLKKESFSDETFNEYTYLVNEAGDLEITIVSEFGDIKQRIVTTTKIK
jgi:hypothetical protein